ncbi:hypothetical protein BUALT_Bualt01G0200900 [Buddleja alternifolia]|uniref:Transposase n=1 Tax=Buddleja alternifolia TaxID=168488 RepID=A0AAV6Y8L6_9LAMI|nr:hypothetical protein BUALT_Bualt01G0200900 [Buddleja alternifolia]
MGDNNREIEVGIEDVTSTRKLTSTSGITSKELRLMGVNMGNEVAVSVAVSNKRVIGRQELKPFNKEVTRRELAMMVVLHDYPLSMVEHVGFQRFVASFQSSFQMISRNTLKNDIMKIYGDEKAKCHKALEKLKCRIAITTDMWTSGNNKKGFMVITGHYIDDFWVLQSCMLRFIYVPAPHTVKALSQHLVGALIDWNIDQKLSTIIVDNCTMNDAMIDCLGKAPKERYVIG